MNFILKVNKPSIKKKFTGSSFIDDTIFQFELFENVIIMKEIAMIVYMMEIIAGIAHIYLVQTEYPFTSDEKIIFQILTSVR